MGLSGREHALPPCQGGTHHPSAQFPAENASCSPCTELLNSITMTPECISSTTSWSLPSLASERSTRCPGHKCAKGCTCTDSTARSPRSEKLDHSAQTGCARPRPAPHEHSHTFPQSQSQSCSIVLGRADEEATRRGASYASVSAAMLFLDIDISLCLLRAGGAVSAQR